MIFTNGPSYRTPGPVSLTINDLRDDDMLLKIPAYIPNLLRLYKTCRYNITLNLFVLPGFESECSQEVEILTWHCLH